MLLAVALVSAQPPASATYDRERKVNLQGPVTRIEWANPNAFVFVNVRDAAGVTTNWAVEVGNPLDLERDGWKRSSLKIGDVVAVEGIPARGARRQASPHPSALPASVCLRRRPSGRRRRPPRPLRAGPTVRCGSGPRRAGRDIGGRRAPTRWSRARPRRLP